MMTLTTVSAATDNNGAVVFWRCGRSRRGVLDVRFMFKAPEGEASVIAELIAIRHLITERKVFNVIPGRGSSLCLNLSNPVAKQLIEGEKPATFASGFARFLQKESRLGGANIEVSQDMDFMVPLDTPITDPAYEVLMVEAKQYTGYREMVTSPSIGKVWITQHAAKRYIERSNHSADGVRSPWAALSSILRRSKMERVTLRREVMRHKLYKYVGEQAEVWSQPSSPVRFVLVPQKDGSKVLVTVFERKEKYM